jgi:hypothetical protein
MKTTPHIDAAAGDARSLVAAVETTLAELSRSTGGLNALELAEEQRIRLAARRLLQCAEELAQAKLLVPGSTGQLRPHPLLKVEQELRREITESLRKLCFVAPNRAFVDQQKAQHRARRELADAASPKPQDTP